MQAVLDRPMEDFRTPLLCMKCGQEGYATWESGRSYPVDTSDQFYLRVKACGKIPHLAVEIVCSRCGKIQRDEIP